MTTTAGDIDASPRHQGLSALGPEIEPSLEWRANLVLATAGGLFVNGETTEQVVAITERFAGWSGLVARLFPRWGELTIQIRTEVGSVTRMIGADPTGVDMTRVAGISFIAEQAMQGHLASHRASAAISAAALTPPTPTWLFAAAAAAGASTLSIIFGVQHLAAGTIIAASAGAGAVIRHLLARISANPFVPPFAAAFLAGVIGAVAERLQLSSSLRLVAVCPCMILMPGPHILNGCLDLLRGRVPLGAARLLFAAIVVTAISIGLILGLGLLGVGLPVDPPGRTAPLWEDVAAAGVAVASYCAFFNIPTKMLPWPVVIGAGAHALRWLVIANFGFGPAAAALTACAVVGIVLTPVANRLRFPFAAVGFAAVVSMTPGVFLFRMASGLLQIGAGRADPVVLRDTITDGITAASIVLAMTIGLLIPKLIIDAAGRAKHRMD